MSAPDRHAIESPAAAGLLAGESRPRIVELVAARGRAAALATLAGAHGPELPAPGRCSVAASVLALCVRPERWLLLEFDTPGAGQVDWQRAVAGTGAAIEMSAAYATLLLAGDAVREVLARGCRLDLDARQFAAGQASATVMAQVPVILASLPAGMLLLTPASTARHFREWLAAAAQPFGLVPQSTMGLADLCRSRSG